MLTNLGQIKNDVLVKLNAATTAGYYTDAILNTWISAAHTWAVGIYRLPFTEGRISTTYVVLQEEWNYPEGWKPDSIRLLQIGGKHVEKLNFEDYQLFRENYPSSDERIFSDFGKLYFVNPKIDLSGTITAYGQYAPITLDGTNPSATTLFSNIEDEGNLAIVEEVLCYAKLREKKWQEADFHHKRAGEILAQIWDRYQKKQMEYQTKDRGIFKRIDVVDGSYYEDKNNPLRF